jgi:hypothetical protein
MNTSIESILRNFLLSNKRIQLYRTKVRIDGDKKRRIPVSYNTSYKTISVEVAKHIVECTPIKADILDVRVIGENDYDNQEMLVLTVRPLRSKETVEIHFASMYEIFEIVK